MAIFLTYPFVALLFSLYLSPLTALAGSTQVPNLVLPSSAASHRDAVKDIFVRSYNAYRKYAFGNDTVRPVSGGSANGRNGWGASIVDGLSTMAIMGLDDFLNEGLEFSSKIDFSESRTNDTVSVFETTIRYLGGLLSAYELGGGKNAFLVEKAKEVTDKMAFAWVQPNQKLPFGFLNFTTNEAIVDTSNIAEAGTLDLEWATLTKYTGNDTYRKLAEDSVRAIAAIPPPLAGLPAQEIDPSTNQFVQAYVTWGPGSDSYFEYLIKYARLTNTDDNFFADAWLTAVDSSIHNLLRTSTAGNHLYLAVQDDGKIEGVGTHLDCFHAGNWIYGGRLLNNETIVKYGMDLNEACWNTYASTQTGIGPEVFQYFTTNSSDFSNSNFTALTPSQQAFYDEHGFNITGFSYNLRPEVLESNFIAWRATGDTKYLDRAASAVDSFNKCLVAEQTGGFAALRNVNDPSQGLVDNTQSFWFAEVLKYLYLTFDDPNHIHMDEWVFNTEAHPFKAPPAKPVYGSGRYLSAQAPFVYSETSEAAPPETSGSHFRLFGPGGLDVNIEIDLGLGL
ncbi:hypothetical protein PM082_020407 [Marasmius tenuissimus]|nr:hypothetical protein PM082_020407 [Marasmius tenuissimus]